MYGRVYGINNSAANFILSRPLRSASMEWFMGRNKQHVQADADKRSEHIQSSIASQPNQSNEHACTCHANRTCDCTNGACADNDDTECRTCQCYNCDCSSEQDRNANIHDDTCTCPTCRDYNDYTTAVISPQRERTSTGIWIGNELRDSEQAIARAATTTSNSIRLHTGATV